MEVLYMTIVLYLFIGVCDGGSACNHSIPHGEITWWCGVATDDSSCPYSCHEGYQHHPTVSWVSCSSSGTWGSGWVTQDDLCTPKSCPSTIPNGKLSATCTKKVETSCGYTCNTGYQPNATVNSITCKTATNWSVDPHLLCKNYNQCPYEPFKGDLDLSCTRGLEENCSYACHLGYLPSSPEEPTIVTCGPNLSWNKPLSSLCTKLQCPATIQDGYIPTSCSREYRSYCYHYICNSGYQKPPGGPSLRCNATGHWEWETSAAKILCARAEDLCPSDFKNGQIVWHCSRQAGSTCTYDCNEGCTESSIAWLNCQSDGTWNKNTDDLCNCEETSTTSTSRVLIINSTKVTSGTTLPPTPTPTSTLPTTRSSFCSAAIPDGRISVGCNRLSGYQCGFSCNLGCSPTLTSLYCQTDGIWRFQETACDCQTGQSTSTPSVNCPLTIPNGKASEWCSRSHDTYCPYTCFNGCTRTRDNLYCASNGVWVYEEDACDCKATEVKGTSSSVGAIIGGIAGSVILITIILTAAFCIVRTKYRNQQPVVSGARHDLQIRMNQQNVNRPTTNQARKPAVQTYARNTQIPVNAIANTAGQSQGGNQPYRTYHTYISVEDVPIGTGASGFSNPEMNQPNQYASIQDRYNDYLTPYSALQLNPGIETLNREDSRVSSDYARIGDISSDSPEHRYSTVEGNVFNPTDPPPSYEESQIAAVNQQNIKL